MHFYWLSTSITYFHDSATARTYVANAQMTFTFLMSEEEKKQNKTHKYINLTP